MKKLNAKIVSSAVLLPLSTSLLAAKPEQPNILIIFTDDQGYADFGFMGSTTNHTPVMDKLADEGTVFTDCYAQHVSGPSRAALLTGRYPLRNGGRNMPASEVTFAELTKSVGYQTACIGKWDVSARKAVIEQMPNAQGFDYYFGTLGANDGGKVQIHENNTPKELITDMSTLTHLYTDKAINFIETRDQEKPFLLYVAHTMLHHRIGVSEEFIGKSNRGLYGDAVEELDYEIGRILNTLEENGLRENTLIIYMTDNGPWSQHNYRKKAANVYPGGEIFWGDGGALRDGKGSCYEGGSRTPCVMSLPGKIPQGTRKDGLIASIDLAPTFATLCGYEMRDDVIIDGVDQTKFIFSKSNKSARKSFCYLQVTNIGQVNIEDFKAIRNERWKLLMPDRKPDKQHLFLSDFGTNDYELYDLKNDISESKNLINEYPKIANQLKQMYAEMVESFKTQK
ncbi:MAG: sulfatase-like hydrolase/transferase [Rikenellaceae bacterium]